MASLVLTNGDVQNLEQYLTRRVVCILLLFSYAFLGCEDNAPVKIENIEPVPVITSFISPQDTVITVKIGQSQPIFTETDWLGDVVDNATVTISDGTKIVHLLFDNKNTVYQVDSSELQIVANKTYFLKVVFADGTVNEAQCTVPPLNNTLTFNVDSAERPNLHDMHGYLLQFSWKDIHEEVNYYRLFATSKVVHLDTSANRPEYWGDINFSDQSPLASDSDSPNTTFFKSIEYTPYGKISTFKAFAGYLLNVDMHYYRYHKSLEEYSSGDPFVETPMVYTNIIGGRGVFCAFNYYRVEKGR